MNEVFEKLLERLEENAFEVHTREYGNVEVVGIDAINDVIEQVAEEYKGGWIPCSERLPEEKGDYLVTCNDGKVRVWWFVVSDDLKCWRDGGNNLKPIAWQPLPEPYQEIKKSNESDVLIKEDADW